MYFLKRNFVDATETYRIWYWCLKSWNDETPVDMSCLYGSSTLSLGRSVPLSEGMLGRSQIAKPQHPGLATVPVSNLGIMT